MKKSLFFAALFIAAFVFTSCDDETNGGSLKIEAKVVNGNDYNDFIEEIRVFTANYGEMLNFRSDIPRKGQLFVTYYDIRSAVKAVESPTERIFQGKKIGPIYILNRQSSIKRR